jgi:hypothetical protein
MKAQPAVPFTVIPVEEKTHIGLSKDCNFSEINSATLMKNMLCMNKVL